jgi:His/Glu/Gln/Arg/opine family amino acid ABC transporter permease subunit
MDIDLLYTLDALPRLLKGALITVEVAVAAMALSLVVAAAFTLLRESGSRAGAAGIRAYLSYIRGTPLLVQILLVYYGLPKLGLELSPLVAGILALGLSSAAYTTEIIRGGLAAIPRGQVEAALALGLRRLAIWSHHSPAGLSFYAASVGERIHPGDQGHAARIGYRRGRAHADRAADLQ